MTIPAVSYLFDVRFCDASQGSALTVNNRLDQALVERGLCESREKAKRAVLAGQVFVNQQRARKPSDPIKATDEILLTVPEKYVSRGGHKLEHALRVFQMDVRDMIAVDLGASTGGFTDCLLQHGARKVYAVDVGQGQLAWKLRQDARVVVVEKTNAREITLAKLREATTERCPPELEGTASSVPIPSIDLVTIDCSFISLRKILPAAVALLSAAGKIAALIKPQFEAGKSEAAKGKGVITDSAIHQRVLRELEDFVRGATTERCPPILEGNAPSVPHLGHLRWHGVTESPLLGPAGNKEFFVLLEKTK